MATKKLPTKQKSLKKPRKSQAATARAKQASTKKLEIPSPNRKSNKPKVKHPAEQFYWRRHIVPAASGIGTMILVFALFNAQVLWSSLQKDPILKTDPVPKIVDERLSAEPNSVDLQIEKLGVRAPVNYTQDAVDEKSVQQALRDGVLQFGPSVTPDVVGNTVIVGHSSSVPWAKGSYKFVFAHLDKLAAGDRIALDYKGTKYLYEVSSSRVVAATEVGVMSDTTNPILTLITCYPVGTNAKRLVVVAKMVSPTALAASTKQQLNQYPSNDSLPAQATSPFQSVLDLF
jgi:sortase A